MFSGPAAYYSCVSQQLAALEASPSKPSLAGVSSDERAMIESACRPKRMFSGPAAYYSCISQQLAGVSQQQDSSSTSHPKEKIPPSSGMPRVTRNQEVSQKPRRIPPPPSKRNELVSQSSSGIAPEAPQQKSVWPPQKTEAATPSTTIPKRPTTALTPVPTTSSLEQFLVIAIVVIVGGFVLKFLYGLRKRKCTKCGNPASVPGAYCADCTAKIQEEARRANAQRQAEERARVDEQRRQKERAEEEARRRLRTMEDLQRLTGTQFEELIASLFKRDGYVVRRCGGSGDEGIDLILELSDAKDVVQCKRWKSDIGSPIVREFYGSLMHANARHGFIITTASFSQSARAFALGKPISLIAGREILRWVDGAYSSREENRQRTHSPRRDVGDGFDPYVVLGVTRSASREEIRIAYHREMADYHPDKVAHLGAELRELANRKAQAINRAYEELMNSTPA
jgi:restriction system protein